MPTDEGFWAADAAGGEVWVQLVGNGESPTEILSGTSLTVAGTMSSPPGIAPMTTDARIETAGYVALVAYADVHVD